MTTQGLIDDLRHRAFSSRSEIEINVLNQAAARLEELESLAYSIAESVHVGRHDGLPEIGPAKDAHSMWCIARQALHLSLVDD